MGTESGESPRAGASTPPSRWPLRGGRVRSVAHRWRYGRSSFVISIKCCLFILRADNEGEGGTLALLGKIPQPTKHRGGSAKRDLSTYSRDLSHLQRLSHTLTVVPPLTLGPRCTSVHRSLTAKGEGLGGGFLLSGGSQRCRGRRTF